ncbi:MAG: ribonuclease PH [Actinobacteria bacterium]|nr:ribonuclease PH [Actinomycetota bacterium]
MRADGRQPDELRPIRIEPGFITSATGSVLIAAGTTRVICTAMVEEHVPGWRRGSGKGWVTAEYGMLPGSTDTRKQRDASRGKVDGRSTEIQRLIGRSLRSVMDLEKLGERSVWVDCDVIQADGGTRCASITGGYVALEMALQTLVEKGLIGELPLRDSIAAVSVGVVDGQSLLDLPYVEDSRAEVDMNVVATGSGLLVEVQATAEGPPVERAVVDGLLDMALAGCAELTVLQRAAIAG